MHGRRHVHHHASILAISDMLHLIVITLQLLSHLSQRQDDANLDNIIQQSVEYEPLARLGLHRSASYGRAVGSRLPGVSSRPLYMPVAHLETQISRIHILDI